MIMELELGEIVYCNLKLKTLKNKKIELKNVVFSYNYDKKKEVLIYENIEDRMLINKTFLKEDLIIEKIEIIERLGFKQKTKEYTLAKANKLSKRDKMGGYE